jgi:hypothetical protein
MSVESIRQENEPMRARVLEVGDLPASEVRRYARGADEIHFERRGGRTFLVSDR